MTALNDFLLSSKEAFLRNPTDGKTTIVMGNEAGDLDSVASAIAYAWILSNGSTPTPAVALIQTPAADLALRPENIHALSLAGIADPASVLLTPAALPALHPSTPIALIDHNALGPAFPRPGNVIAIFDHHADEGQHLNASPRTVAPAGSTASHVAAHLPPHAPKELALLLLSAILLDTSGLKPGGRALDVDRAAAPALAAHAGLLPDALTSTGEIHEVEALRELTGTLNQHKAAVAHLTPSELLRRDYKEYNFTHEGADVRVGLASVPLGLSNWAGEGALRSAGQEYMRARGVGVLGVLTSFDKEKKDKGKKDKGKKENKDKEGKKDKKDKAHKEGGEEGEKEHAEDGEGKKEKKEKKDKAHKEGGEEGEKEHAEDGERKKGKKDKAHKEGGEGGEGKKEKKEKKDKAHKKDKDADHGEAGEAHDADETGEKKEKKDKAHKKDKGGKADDGAEDEKKDKKDKAKKPKHRRELAWLISSSPSAPPTQALAARLWAGLEASPELLVAPHAKFTLDDKEGNKEDMHTRVYEQGNALANRKVVAPLVRAIIHDGPRAAPAAGVVAGGGEAGGGSSATGSVATTGAVATSAAAPTGAADTGAATGADAGAAAAAADGGAAAE